MRALSNNIVAHTWTCSMKEMTPTGAWHECEALHPLDVDLGSYVNIGHVYAEGLILITVSSSLVWQFIN